MEYIDDGYGIDWPTVMEYIDDGYGIDWPTVMEYIDDGYGIDWPTTLLNARHNAHVGCSTWHGSTIHIFFIFSPVPMGCYKQRKEHSPQSPVVLHAAVMRLTCTHVHACISAEPILIA
jgi:hypothetical protein